ncbi:NTP transferase domain-containing protein, partial [Escherichia coli]|uniref:sugar phosphate nucleotidyltransferase n=1 Tax=Escherichia coli TaxID=562 RepID=UPI001F37D37D
MLFPIIMAGGTGSRLWPLSRESFPKQYLKLYGDMTMLQSTIARLNTLDCSIPLVICNEEHRFIVAEQLKKINKLDKNILLEPQGKNTAPAITLCSFAALKYAKNDEDPLLPVLAADHVIGNISS